MKKIFRCLFVFLFGIFLTGCVNKSLKSGIVVDKSNLNTIDNIRKNTNIVSMPKLNDFKSKEDQIDPFCDDLDCYIKNFKSCNNSQINLKINNNQYSSYIYAKENGVCSFFIANTMNQKKSLQCDFYSDELSDDLFYYVIYGYKPKDKVISDKVSKIIDIACDENSLISVKQ